MDDYTTGVTAMLPSTMYNAKSIQGVNDKVASITLRRHIIMREMISHYQHEYSSLKG